MKTILIADDDKKITAALSARLTAAGYGVLTAANGFDALKLILEQKPHLVLLDICMPVGMGFSVAERLREINHPIPVIFLTASKKPGLWAAAQEVGAAGFFEKPYDPEKLLDAVERSIVRSAAAHA